MNIGILTFHNAINYGGVLQAYALQEFLNDIGGIKAEMVGYCSSAVDRQYSFVSLKQSGSIKAFLLCNATTAARKQKKSSFQKFVKDNIKMGPPVTILSAEALKTYDCIIVGSDQVWNSACTKGDKAYLLDIEELQVKHISYAASIGNRRNFENFQHKYHVDFRKALANFSYISVRERDTTAYIKELTGRECFTAVDPVLLYGRDNWIETLKEFEFNGEISVETNENYILVYNIGNFSLTFAFAKMLSAKTGFKIKAINKDVKGDVKFAGCENCSNASPVAFVSLIEKAQYVVTDSFHATAFSIMLHKKFFTIANPNSDNTNSRLLNILEDYNLRNRYVTKLNIPKDYDVEIDYSNIETKMKIEREESRKWLLDALEWRV